MSGNHSWILFERHVIHILYTHYPNATWEERGAIFNAIFGTKLEGKRVGKEYHGRNVGRAETSASASRSRHWDDHVCKDEFKTGPFDAQEQADRARALRGIQAAIGTLGLQNHASFRQVNLRPGCVHAGTNVAAPANGASSIQPYTSPYTPGPMQTAPNSQPPTSNPLQPHNTGATTRSSASSARPGSNANTARASASTASGAPNTAVPAPPAQPPVIAPLEMYHTKDIYWSIPAEGRPRDDSTYASYYDQDPHSLGPISPQDPLYQLGGFARRVAIDGVSHRERDMQLCNRDYCRVCCPTNRPLLPIPAQSPTGGLTFVHSSDCTGNSAQGNVYDFTPQAEKYSTLLPPPNQIVGRRVVFMDGQTRLVASCSRTTCPGRR